MNRRSKRENELLAQVVERFQFHSGEIKAGNPIVADAALKMCEVEMWEMWVLTQD